MRGLLIVAGVAVLAGCELRDAAEMAPKGSASTQQQAQTQQQRIEFLAAPDSLPYPFSPAVRAGGFLFLSGQIGSRVENGRAVLVPGGIEPETRQTMDNIEAILKRNGSSLERVVKCTVMIADMADWPRINTIYAEYFPGPKPARSALGANGLALGAKVEIECIAAV